MKTLHEMMSNQNAERDMLQRLESHLMELQESSQWDQAGYDEPGWSEMPTLNRLASRRSSPHSYIRDRQDGRYLPYYENEWELRQIRAACRNISAFTSVAIGALSTLDGYVVQTGYKFRIKAKEESQETELTPLVTAIQRVVDQFLKENSFLSGLDSEIHIQSRSDGEKFIALYPQTGYVARAMVVEPDEITEPENARSLNTYLGCDDHDSCFWEYGILTRYNEELNCHDTETPLSYHVVRSDDGRNWDCIAAERMVHFKRNTSRKAKRGVSDYFAMLEDIEGEGKLNASLRQGMEILANIPFVKEFPIGTVHSGDIPGADISSISLPKAGGGSRAVERTKYHPGTVPRVNGGKYRPGPLAQMRNDAVMDCLKYLLKRMGSFWTIPNFMMSGDTDTALYSAVLAIGSPFVNQREKDQAFYGKGFVEIIEKALRIAYETGQISHLTPSFERLMSLIEIDYEAPQVTMTNETEQAQRDQLDIQSGIKTIQTAREQRGIDHDKEEERMAIQRRNQPVAVEPAIESMRNPYETANQLLESGEWGEWNNATPQP